MKTDLSAAGYKRCSALLALCPSVSSSLTVCMLWSIKSCLLPGLMHICLDMVYEAGGTVSTANKMIHPCTPVHLSTVSADLLVPSSHLHHHLPHGSQEGTENEKIWNSNLASTQIPLAHLPSFWFASRFLFSVFCITFYYQTTLFGLASFALNSIFNIKTSV